MLILKITAGFILDLIFGDPRGFPHPVRFIGTAIQWLEKPLIKFRDKKISGALLLISILTITFIITFYISKLHFVLEIFLIYTLFCVKSLALEVKKVYSALIENDLEKARAELAMLVSRDTKKMTEEDISRAAVETLSENIVDGIISPMFYLFIGGVPLAYAYKAVNTLDSMVGYKNDKYIDFGWASARLDDVLNYIPARVTGLILIPLAALILRLDFLNSIRVAFRDRKNHSSPNSALPEGAAAGALGIQLGGPAVYFGKKAEKPFIGDAGREITVDDILKSIKLMYASSFIGLAAGSLLYFLFI